MKGLVFTSINHGKMNIVSNLCPQVTIEFGNHSTYTLVPDFQPDTSRPEYRTSVAQHFSTSILCIPFSVHQYRINIQYRKLFPNCQNFLIKKKDPHSEVPCTKEYNTSINTSYCINFCVNIIIENLFRFGNLK